VGVREAILYFSLAQTTIIFGNFLADFVLFIIQVQFQIQPRLFPVILPVIFTAFASKERENKNVVMSVYYEMRGSGSCQKLKIIP
jgi:hypothetical protein